MAKKKVVKSRGNSAEKLRKPPSKKARTEILKKTDGRCHLCARVLREDWHLDHLKTFYSGGECVESNFLPICPSCNNKKRVRGPKKMRRMLEIGHYMHIEVRSGTDLGKQVAKRVREYKQAAKSRRKKVWDVCMLESTAADDRRGHPADILFAVYTRSG